MARIGPYELLERIGIGGMAEVFKARHSGAQGFERMVAVKRILPNIAADPDFVRMFIDEAKIAVQLQHPNIAQIYDLGRDGGELFIALEYIEGRDMKAIAARQQKMGRHLPLSFVIYAAVKICEALQHAHFAKGASGEPLKFIHRDISPQNILVSHEGAVKVIDFGLAKATGRLVTTQAGVVKGKLAYLSAEQARGEDIDHRSDIFSLGTCFYEWLTGERLFLRNNDPDTVVAVQRAMVPPLRAVRPELPMELQVIVKRALEADPSRRYQSAAQMQEALMAFAVDAGMPVRRRSASKHMLLLFPEDSKGDAAVPSRRETIRSVEKKLPLNAEARDLVSAVPQAPGGRASALPAAAAQTHRRYDDEATRAFSDISAVEELSLVDLIEPDVASIPFDDEISSVPIVEHDSTALPLEGSVVSQSWDDVTRSVGRQRGSATGAGGRYTDETADGKGRKSAGGFSDATTGNLNLRAEALAREADLGDDYDDRTVTYSAGAVGEYLRRMEDSEDPLGAEATRSGALSTHHRETPRPPAFTHPPDFPVTEPTDTDAPVEFVDETAEEKLPLAEFDDLTYVENLPNLDDFPDDTMRIEEPTETDETTQPSIDVPSFVHREEDR